MKLLLNRGTCATVKDELNNFRLYLNIFDISETALTGNFSLLAANYLLCGLVVAAVTTTHDGVPGVKLHNPDFPFVCQNRAAFLLAVIIKLITTVS